MNTNKMTKIALISDIHSNLEAFEAVLKEIKKLKIKKTFCLGDIVGYGANPNECVDLIRNNKIISVKGNHDHEATLLENVEWFIDVAREAILWTKKQLTDKNKNFLKNLPASLEFENVLLVHGSPRDNIYDYILQDMEDYDYAEFFSLAGKDVIACGLSHVQFVKEFNSKLILNPGSVGQPRDLNRDAAFCIFDIKSLKIDFKRVRYNIEKAANKILKVGLPSMLANRLYSGR